MIVGNNERSASSHVTKTETDAGYLYRRQSKEIKKSRKINSRTSCGTITATQLFYF